MLCCCVLGEIGFEPFGKFAASKHNTSLAAFTLETDIRAEADHSPFIGAAGMLLAEAQVVVELKVGEHNK
jgi:hypothetical protein